MKKSEKEWETFLLNIDKNENDEKTDKEKEQMQKELQKVQDWEKHILMEKKEAEKKVIEEKERRRWTSKMEVFPERNVSLYDLPEKYIDAKKPADISLNSPLVSSSNSSGRHNSPDIMEEMDSVGKLDSGRNWRRGTGKGTNDKVKSTVTMAGSEENDKNIFQTSLSSLATTLMQETPLSVKTSGRSSSPELSATLPYFPPTSTATFEDDDPTSTNDNGGESASSSGKSSSGGSSRGSRSRSSSKGSKGNGSRSGSEGSRSGSGDEK